MVIPELRYLLRNSFCAETSQNPQQWSKENPFFGHCALCVLVVQSFFGGTIQRALFPPEWRERLGSRSHYWNVGVDGRIIDLFRDQFPIEFPYDAFLRGEIGELLKEEDWRGYILSFPDTVKRYRIVRGRLHKLLEENPIFSDERFQQCWDLAFSPHAKCVFAHFACVVYDGRRIIARDVNRLMTEQFGRERFCALDGSSCIRLGISSRHDPTIGDCGHAPLWCLPQVFEQGYPPSSLPHLDFYEAGFNQDGSPWVRSEPTYTCIYCQNMFAIFGLDKIWGVYEGQWKKLYTRDSFYSSAKYTFDRGKVDTPHEV